ncbi:unnamed protein product [Pylaiella littoralis]
MTMPRADEEREDTDRRSSSYKDKSGHGSSSHKSGRSSKHSSSSTSRDKGKSSSHSSSRKRERSEEDRSSEHSKEHRSKDRSSKDDDDGERSKRHRRGEDKKDGSNGASKSSSSHHKSKHRSKEGKSSSSSSSSKHKKESRSSKDKDRRRGSKHSSGSSSSKNKEDTASARANGDGGVDKDTHSGAQSGTNRDSVEQEATNGNRLSVPAAADMADGEEEGELVFEPKKNAAAAAVTASNGTAPAAAATTAATAAAAAATAASAAAAAKAFVDSERKPEPPAAPVAAPEPAPVNDEEAEEAARFARIAARAEERAAERAKARAAAAAVAASPSSGNAQFGGGGGYGGSSGSSSRSTGAAGGDGARDSAAAAAAAPLPVMGAPAAPGKLAFKTKKQREQEALQRLEEQRKAKRREQEAAAAERGTSERQRQVEEDRRRQKARETEREEARAQREKEKERELLREQYLGKKKVKKKIVKPSEKFSKIFQFDWDASEDTSRDANPLYSQRAQLNASFGRGYLAGIDMREQRKDSAFLTALMQKRQEEQRRAEEADHSLSAQDRADRERLRTQQMAEVAAFSLAEADGMGDDPVLKGAHWSEKPLAEMAERDWRIFREDFDIRVKGGKAPLPLRFWEEGNLPGSVMEAIRELGYEKPSPIQRQAIPIGMERRDIIGIAETGSGKTAAFGIPMISYILSLDTAMRDGVADQGPLALIMAPTRELAIQIEEECKKFCKFAGLNTVCVVGGQDIEAQAFTLRKGVEIIIGTPGRLNDCVEKHYLVLNQCNYVVLDEADRMIDMGFEDQVLAVLEAMGGTLKADDAELAYKQEKKAKLARSAKDLVRVTAMFSATMPPAVEKMAKKYLRHPAIVQARSIPHIGDEDTGKNRRIDQRVLWMTEAQKKTKVVELLRGHDKDDRVLVFINTKKNADMLGRQLEQAGFSAGVLHGGKTQARISCDQREENLESFRDGVYTVLVATDVASRGLDIPDVKVRGDQLRASEQDRDVLPPHRANGTRRQGRHCHVFPDRARRGDHVRPPGVSAVDRVAGAAAAHEAQRGAGGGGGPQGRWIPGEQQAGLRDVLEEVVKQLSRFLATLCYSGKRSIREYTMGRDC